MQLNKVEMRFTVDQVHTSVILFRMINVVDSAPFGGGNRLVHLRSLMSQLSLLLVNLGPCVFCYSVLQEDIFHLVKMVQILFHISQSLRCLASVLCHHIEVDQRPDIAESTFEQ